MEDFKPFVVVDTSTVLRRPLIACEPTFHGFRFVHDSIAHSEAFGRLRLQTVEAWEGAVGHARRYERVTGSKYNLQVLLERFKQVSVESGGSPEAIQALSHHVRFTKKEIDIMADKLAKKTAPAAKAAAKTPDVPKGTKTKDVGVAVAKKAGNPEALAKARAARAEAGAAPDTRKLKVLTEKGANPYRDGTKAAATFELFKKAKTVQDVKDAATDDHDLGYIRYASRDGHISLS